MLFKDVLDKHAFLVAKYPAIADMIFVENISKLSSDSIDVYTAEAEAVKNHEVTMLLYKAWHISFNREAEQRELKFIESYCKY